MTPPGTFERVYQVIKQRLCQGLYRPGTRLDVSVLSKDLNASVTPVRDALHRLTGERFVEATKYDGFRTPMMTETVLRQLYDWHLDLLIALMKHRSSTIAAQISSDELAHGSACERTNDLFLAFARTSGNQEHVIALRSVTERLEPVQQIEDALLDGTEAETNAIIAALLAHDRDGLRKSLIHYHRRRERIVPELLAGLLNVN